MGFGRCGAGPQGYMERSGRGVRVGRRVEGSVSRVRKEITRARVETEKVRCLDSDGRSARSALASELMDVEQ